MTLSSLKSYINSYFEEKKKPKSFVWSVMLSIMEHLSTQGHSNRARLPSVSPLNVPVSFHEGI